MSPEDLRAGFKGENMKRLLGVVAVNLLLLGAAAFAQQPEVTSKMTPEAAAIKVEAENISRAFVNGDFGKVLDLTYPKLIELSGGRKKVLAEVEGQMKELRDMGTKVISLTVGEPETSVRAGATLVAMVPTHLKMETAEYDMEMESYWLAVSADEGKAWRFISGSSLEVNVLKLLLPEAVDKIKLPAVAQPVMRRKSAK
jgi:membrane carboxypeptidase/penicillin-binding protein PbpC